MTDDHDDAVTETATALVPLELAPEGRPSVLVLGHDGRSLRFEQSVVTVGSHPSNDLVIEDASVSRFHLEFRLEEGGGVRVVDMRSSNGTVLDGVRVLQAYVRRDSTLHLGRTALSVDIEQPRASSPPVWEGSSFGQLRGKSRAMREAFVRLERAAGVDSTLLIAGETGTGKEEAARGVHEASGRKGRAFAVLDCSALAPQLVESEIFGHVAGAFSGATADRRGALEAADGGTLFIDEVGELPLELQPKLLRFLEEQTYRPLGGTRRTVDARVIAASHRDLRGMVNEGRFRADLYYRLAVLEVRLPPLRERPADLPLLVEALLERLGASESDHARLTSRAAIRDLSFHTWPGNVRELRNHLERALVLGDAAALQPASAEAPQARTHLSLADARQEAIAAFERVYLERLLEETGGAVAEAAERAGVHRVHLYRLLRRHDLR